MPSSAKFVDVRAAVLTKLNKLGKRASVDPPINEVDIDDVTTILRSLRDQNKPVSCT
jgi:hypothetical protein